MSHLLLEKIPYYDIFWMASSHHHTHELFSGAIRGRSLSCLPIMRCADSKALTLATSALVLDTSFLFSCSQCVWSGLTLAQKVLSRTWSIPEHGPWVNHLTFPSFSEITNCITNSYTEKCILNASHSAWYRVSLWERRCCRELRFNQIVK